MAYNLPDALRCPGCAKLYADLLAIGEAGGTVKSIGLMLEATCGICGECWPVNSAWRKRKEINDANIHFHKCFTVFSVITKCRKMLNEKRK